MAGIQEQKDSCTKAYQRPRDERFLQVPNLRHHSVSGQAKCSRHFVDLEHLLVLFLSNQTVQAVLIPFLSLLAQP